MTGALAGGLVLTALVTGLLTLWWGRAALVPGVGFGLLATVIQVISAGLVAPAAQDEFGVLIRRWAVGLGLRVGGVVIFGVAVLLNRELFPPLPSAFGYLGVVVPLLFWEIRFLR